MLLNLSIPLHFYIVESVSEDASHRVRRNRTSNHQTMLNPPTQPLLPPVPKRRELTRPRNPRPLNNALQSLPHRHLVPLAPPLPRDTLPQRARKIQTPGTALPANPLPLTPPTKNIHSNNNHPRSLSNPRRHTRFKQYQHKRRSYEWGASDYNLHPLRRTKRGIRSIDPVEVRPVVAASADIECDQRAGV